MLTLVSPVVQVMMPVSTLTLDSAAPVTVTGFSSLLSVTPVLNGASKVSCILAPATLWDASTAFSPSIVSWLSRLSKSTLLKWTWPDLLFLNWIVFSVISESAMGEALLVQPRSRLPLRS